MSVLQIKSVFELSGSKSFRLWMFILLSLLTISCTKEVQLTVIKPAEVSTSGIQKIAVGSFEIAEIHDIRKVERAGNWQKAERTLSTEEKKVLSNQVRARVVNALSVVPVFELVYTDEFAKLENDQALRDAIAAGGFKTTEVDAVINGKIWLNIVRIDSSETNITDLAYEQGGGMGSLSYKLEVLVYWPYKSISSTMGLELKLTRLNPTEVIAVTYDSRAYHHKFGGKPKDTSESITEQTQSIATSLASANASKSPDSDFEESDLVMPNFDQLVADLSESIAAQFVRRISITQETVNYPIASGGDPSARILIEAGAYEKAIAVLTAVLDRSEDKDPDDFYNLGLCFEAVGDYGLAAISYNDAIKRDPNNLQYAQGIGRIERKKRENLRLRQQLTSKQ